MAKKIKTLNDYCHLHSLNSVNLERDAIQEGDEVIKIEGFVCKFGHVNENYEQVTADSFDKFFKRLQEGAIMPSINYMHSNRIIGGWNKLEPKEGGLWGEGFLTKSPFVVNEVLPLIKHGVLNHFSTEGWVTEGEWKTTNEETGDGFFLATNFELLRVSVVDIPAEFGAVAEISENGITLERRKRQNQPSNTEGNKESEIIII